MKKYFLTLLVVFCTLIAVKLSSNEFHDYGFQQDRMIIHHNAIYIISTFDNEDRVSCYDFHGHRHWEVPFHAKIISWKLVHEKVPEDTLFVLSKDRHGHKTYLTNLDLRDGRVNWQKP